MASGGVDPAASEIRDALARVLTSRTFEASRSLSRFLRFVVEETLEGRADQLKEFVVAVKVYGRKDDFNPKDHSLIRVEASRLRTRLETYYSTEGREDSILIRVPKGGYVPVFERRIPSTPASENSIAVLPFTNVSPQPDHDYFSDGLTEELIDSLSRLEGLKVVARTSVFRFKGRSEDIRSIAEKLGVRILLEGSVRTRGDRIRISVRLVNAADGCQLWSERYERQLHDIFAIQDEIASAVASSLHLRLFGRSAPPRHVRTENIGAYNCYLLGRYHWNRRTRDGLTKSIECYQEALQTDPAFALAFAGLSDSRLVQVMNDWAQPQVAVPEARRPTQRVVELAPELVESHVSAGCVRSCLEWDWEGGEAEFRQAIRLNPSSALAHYLFPILNLSPRGLFDEALAQIDCSLQLDPISPVMHRDAGLVHYLKRDFEGALDALHRAQELDPDFRGVHFWFGCIYAQLGLCDEAVSAFERRLVHGDANTRVLATLGFTYARSGKTRQARDILKELNDKHSPPLSCAIVHIGLRERAEAIRLLEEALERGYPTLYQLKVDPIYDDLRPESRFVALLARMNLM